MAIKYGPIVYKVVNKPTYPTVTVTNSGTIDFDLYDGQDATGEKLQEMTAGSTFTATCTSGYLYADFASGEGVFTGKDGVSTGVNPAVVTGDGTWDVAVTAVVTGYEATITFQNGNHTNEWESTRIFDDYTLYGGDVPSIPATAQQIGSISSADGSTTVTTTTGKLAIFSEGGALLGFPEPDVTGEIVTRANQLGFYGEETGALWAFDVTSDGTITISRMIWDD